METKVKLLTDNEKGLVLKELNRLFAKEINYFANNMHFGNYYIQFVVKDKESNWSNVCLNSWTLVSNISDQPISQGIFVSNLDKIKQDIIDHETTYAPSLHKIKFRWNKNFKIDNDDYYSDGFSLSYRAIENGKINLSLTTQKGKDLLKIPNTIFNDDALAKVWEAVKKYQDGKERKKLKGPIHPVDVLAHYLNENGIKTKVRLKCINHYNRFGYVDIKFADNKFKIQLNRSLNNFEMKLESPSTFSDIKDIINHFIYNAGQLFDKKLPTWKDA